MPADASSPLRPLAPTPENGRPVEIEPGILWLRLPLPFALDHVNLWLVDDGDAWTLIDTGFGDAGTGAVWERLLRTVLGGKPVGRVLATHFHPDHLGQAGHLCRTTGAELWMSRTEWLVGRMLAFDTGDELPELNAAHWRRAGMSDEAVARQRAGGNTYRRGVTPIPGRYRRLVAGEDIVLGGGRWRVMVGEGHAPEQVTLWSAERGLLIAADQILPRISPVISVWASEPEADPLGAFLGSLEQYRALPADARILPSHHFPFTGLHQRLGQLAQHHAQRLARVLDCCGRPSATAQIMSALFPRALDAKQESFALSETLAHLNRLWRTGEVSRASDANGRTIWCRG